MNAVNEHEPSRAKIICFPLGHLVATPGALDLLDRMAVNASELLQRHQRGDWGDVPPEDAVENELAIVNGNVMMNEGQRGDVGELYFGFVVDVVSPDFDRHSLLVQGLHDWHNLLLLCVFILCTTQRCIATVFQRIRETQVSCWNGAREPDAIRRHKELMPAAVHGESFDFQQERFTDTPTNYCLVRSKSNWLEPLWAFC